MTPPWFDPLRPRGTRPFAGVVELAFESALASLPPDKRRELEERLEAMRKRGGLLRSLRRRWRAFRLRVAIYYLARRQRAAAAQDFPRAKVERDVDR